MNHLAPIPFALRLAKMPRGETTVSPRLMSPKNRAEWFRREAELMARQQAECDGDGDMAPDNRGRGRPRSTSGTLTARLLAVLRSEPRWWTRDELRRATATVVRFSPIMDRLCEQGLIERGDGYPVRWRAVEGG